MESFMIFVRSSKEIRLMNDASYKNLEKNKILRFLYFSKKIYKTRKCTYLSKKCFHLCHLFFTRQFTVVEQSRLPISASRWQHGPQICFATFMKRKITKLLITQQTLKQEKNKRRFGILGILESFWCMFWLKTVKFYLIKLATDFYWQPSYFLGERASFNIIN